MNRRDREQWASARTLADLGDLTARWLEGDITEQPGYSGPSDIEDAALVPLLAKLNRAGFMTTGSQIGEDGPGYDGAHWQQRAAVEGFAGTELAQKLYDVARSAGLMTAVHYPATLPRRRYHYSRAITVTTRAGRDYTRFGVQLPRRHIRDPHIGHGICGRSAVDALCGAYQLTLIDPEWGRPTRLWDALTVALQPTGSEVQS